MAHNLFPDGISRRTFMTMAAAVAAGSTFGQAPKNGQFELPSLPFAQDALEPVISARTLEFHYGKHHKAYVDALNGLIAGTRYERMTLEKIIQATEDEDNSTQEKIFNNAAQVWNHTFFWNSLAPKGKGGSPSPKLLTAINRAFGSLEACKQALVDAAVAQFGSGWAWLVVKNGRLFIKKTENADTPIEEEDRDDGVPLLTIDVWEHAYYLDYQNRRKDYATAVAENLLNWTFASRNFENA